MIDIDDENGDDFGIDADADVEVSEDGDVEVSEEELRALVEQIERGEDVFELPTELVEDMEIPPVPEVEHEIRLGLAAKIGKMTVGERIKLALKGNRESRGILVRDSARLVRMYVLQNPRITDDEVLMLAKNRSADRELIQRVCKHRQWCQNYQIRLALVSNPKTPMGVGLQLVTHLLERDLRLLTKSKNIPSTISSAAKRIIAQREKGSRTTGGGH